MAPKALTIHDVARRALNNGTFDNWYRTPAQLLGEPMAAMNRTTAFNELARVLDANLPAAIRERSFSKGQQKFYALEVRPAEKADDANAPLNFNLYLPSEVAVYLEQVAQLRKPQPVFATIDHQGLFTFDPDPQIPNGNDRIQRRDNGLSARLDNVYLGAAVKFDLSEIRQRKGILINPQGRKVIATLPDNFDIFNVNG